MRRKKSAAWLLIFALILAQPGCSGVHQPIRNIAKSDTGLAIDTAINVLNDYLRRLALDLYQLNPAELKKAANLTLEARMVQIIEYPVEVAYKELNYKRGVQAIELAFDPSYRSDRVFALMLGISSMIRLSYNGQTEMFMFDTLDPQKLYDSARNLELLHRKLAEQKDGRRYIEVGGCCPLDSIYMLISRIVAVQELVSSVISSKSDRIINKVLHGAATTFLPIGL